MLSLRCKSKYSCLSFRLGIRGKTAVFTDAKQALREQSMHKLATVCGKHELAPSQNALP